MIFISILLFLTWLFPAPAHGATVYIRNNAENGAENGAENVAGYERGGTFAGVGRHYFLLIAVDRYREWPRLPGAVQEARELKNVLVAGYRVDDIRELYDERATSGAIRDCLRQMQWGGTKQLEKNDSLFIYFSGHGRAFGAEGGAGYWIPYNGGLDPDARAHWISHAALAGSLGKIRAGKILVVSDSCFAGGLVDDTHNTHENHGVNGGTGVSRKVLTSGGMGRVPGQSVFAVLLRDALRERAKKRGPLVSIAGLHRRVAPRLRAITGQGARFGNLKGIALDPLEPFFLVLREN